MPADPQVAVANQHVQFAFAVATLVFALLGLVGTFISGSWAKTGLPPEPTPGMFLTGAKRISYHSAQEANRYRYYGMSLSASRASNLLLFTSVLTALTVNFPTFWWVGTGLSVVAIAALILDLRRGWKEAAAQHRLFEERRTKHLEAYGEPIPDDAGLRSE